MLKVAGKLAREREVLLDAIFVRFIHSGRATEAAAAFGVFGLRQMAFTRAGAQNFAAGGDFEPLDHGLLRFDAFGTSHKFYFLLFKKSAQYTDQRTDAQAIILSHRVAKNYPINPVNHIYEIHANIGSVPLKRFALASHSSA